jgi:hypothetical protein
MKCIFKILFSLTLLMGVFSCEKEDITPICGTNDHDSHDVNDFSTRGSVFCAPIIDNVTDPDEDEDFDGVDEVVIDNVTDPDEDEDFDSEEIPGTQN